MQVVSYDEIVHGVAQRLGKDPKDLLKTDAEPLKRFFNEALRQVWVANWWIDNTLIMRRYFAPAYAADVTYTAGDVRYYYPTAKYYQALRATTGNAPINTAYWAEAKERYGAGAFDPTKQYQVGDQVRFADQEFAAFAQPAIGVDPSDEQYWAVLYPFYRVIPFDCSTYIAASSSQGQGSDPAGTGPCFKVWTTITEMRADTAHEDGCYGVLIGYGAPFDISPSRQYYFHGVSTEQDDDRYVIRPDDVLTVEPGRWKQVL